MIRHMYLCSAAVLVAGAGASAQCDSQALASLAPVSYANFGTSLALDGSTLLIGAPNEDNEIGENAGAVYAFTLVNGQWGQYARIVPSNADPQMHFGRSIGLSGGRAIIGFVRGNGTGGGYMFDRFGSSWAQTGFFELPLWQSQLGWSVAIDGDNAAAGAPYADRFELERCGSVTTFFRTGSSWMQDGNVLYPSLPVEQSSAWLGMGLAMRGSVLVAGAPNGFASGSSDRGWARVFNRSGGTWQPGALLHAPIAAPASDYFGYSVACGSGTIVVGAPGGPASAVDGRVFVYKNVLGLWVLDQTIVGPAGVNKRFGYSVALDGDRLAIGGQYLGEVHLFRRGQSGEFFLESTLQWPVALFGTAIALDGSHLVAGSPLADGIFSTDTGFARSYDLTVVSPESCEIALPVTRGSWYGCNTSAADAQTQPACRKIATSSDVWYAYTAPCTGTVAIDTFGSSFDTVLSVYTACPPSHEADTSVACNDDWSQFSTQSRVTLATTAGQNYLIRVASSGTPRGEFVLNIGACIPTPPPACPADWNHSGTLSVQDIFDFLASYFSSAGDFNNSGATTVQDIFDFLAAYFAGCA